MKMLAENSFDGRPDAPTPPPRASASEYTAPADTVLLFSGHRSDLAHLRDALEHDCFHVHCSTDEAEFLDLARTGVYGVVVMSVDIVSPQTVKLCCSLDRIKSFSICPAIVLVGIDNPAIAFDLCKLGVSHYLRKPVSRCNFLRSVNGALDAISYFNTNGQVLSNLDKTGSSSH
jgi:FixJ family two-component response regulator